MPDEFTYKDLAVQVMRDEAQGMYLFGVVLGDEFVAFGARKLGGIDADLAAARAVKAEAALQAQQAQEAQRQAPPASVPDPQAPPPPAESTPPPPE